MARIIVWNKRAEIELEQIIEYLLYAWNEKVAKQYVLRVNHVVNLVANFPYIGKQSTINLSIRSFLISKHTTLVYKIEDDTLTILNVFDNR